MARPPQRSRAARPVASKPLVAIVDDDESVRESLPELLKTLGFEARAFASAREFLAREDMGGTRCLLLDVAMPDMSGPELQQELTLQRRSLSVVFITARSDDALRDRLLQHGAIACLFKPFSEDQLRVAVDAAVRASEVEPT
jgi:FixJ family two-component response regulator